MTENTNTEGAKPHHENKNQEASASSPNAAAIAALKEQQKPANTSSPLSGLERVPAAEGGAPSSNSTPEQQKLQISSGAQTPHAPVRPQQSPKFVPQGDAPEKEPVSQQGIRTGTRNGPLKQNEDLPLKSAVKTAVATSETTHNQVARPEAVSERPKTALIHDPKGDGGRPQSQSTAEPQLGTSIGVESFQKEKPVSQEGARTGPPNEPANKGELSRPKLDAEKNRDTSETTLNEVVRPDDTSERPKTVLIHDAKGDGGKSQTQPTAESQKTPSTGVISPPKEKSASRQGTHPGARNEPLKHNEDSPPKSEVNTIVATSDSTSNKVDESDIVREKPKSGLTTDVEGDDKVPLPNKKRRRSFPQKAKRTETLKFRATLDERNEIIDNIPEGIDFSDWARSVLLGKNIKSKANKAHQKKVIGELGRIGNNVNQIAKHLNTKGIPSDPALAIQLISELHQINSELQKIGEAK